MTALFDAADLTTPLGRTPTDEEAASAEGIVWGWVKGPLGLDTRPDTVDPTLFAYAVELGVMVIDQQLGKTTRTRGPFTEGFDTKRWAAILDEVRDNAAGAGGTDTSGPLGSFPPAACWPDPILVAPNLGPPPPAYYT